GRRFCIKVPVADSWHRKDSVAATFFIMPANSFATLPCNAHSVPMNAGSKERNGDDASKWMSPSGANEPPLLSRRPEARGSRREPVLDGSEVRWSEPLQRCHFRVAPDLRLKLEMICPGYDSQLIVAVASSLQSRFPGVLVFLGQDIVVQLAEY